MFFFCHKCGESMGVPNLIRRLDPDLYLEYVRERAMESRIPAQTFEPRVPESRRLSAKGLVPISTLPPNHTALRFVDSRGIPEDWRPRLLYAQDFYAWANTVVPGKYTRMAGEPRLVIPFVGADGVPVGFQGRSLGDSQAKYVTVQVDPGKPFLFGLDRVDPTRVVLALEGPIDAMFLPNAVATGGGDVASEVLRSKLDPARITVVYDNERRSPATVKKMLSAVDRGLAICVWPVSISHKDVNEMVASGMTPAAVHSIIEASTHSGMAARAAVALWRRC